MHVGLCSHRKFSSKATILLVGYFVLGPTELFKLTKEIGKFIQNFRTLGAEATKSFESTMENQVELQELRKAQDDLNNAFNFRRSINVDQEAEAFTELPKVNGNEATMAAATAAAGTEAAKTTDAPVKRKKKRRRVKKKKVQEIPEETVPAFTQDIPDLDMSSAFQDGLDAVNGGETEAEMAARLRKERFERLEKAQARAESAEKTTENPADETDWFKASESDIASNILAEQRPEELEAANNRFANQLSGKWNDNVMENEETLSPLAQIMDRLAILEEEREAANRRLDEEFFRRQEIEEKFYREKRDVLEMAAGEVSAAAYSNFDFSDDEAKTDTTDNASTSTDDKDKVKAADDAEEKLKPSDETEVTAASGEKDSGTKDTDDTDSLKVPKDEITNKNSTKKEVKEETKVAVSKTVEK